MPKFRTRLTLALVSAATIALELMWMRVLSLRFWHHFAYLIVSTALLGFGASGTVLTLARRFVIARRRGVLSAAALVFALAIPVSVRLAELVPLNVQFMAWDFWQAGYLVLIGLIFLFPVLPAGAAVGVALMDDPDRIAGHYAANLVGSGAGAVLAVAALQVLTTPQVIILLASLAYLGGLVVTAWRRPISAAGALAVGVALVAVHWFLPYAPGLSQYKMLAVARRMPGTETIYSTEGPLGRIDVVAGPAIHHAPGLSLKCDKPIPPHVLMITDGDQTSPVYDARTPRDYAFLDWTTQALPYRLASRPRVLIIGAGGGADIGLTVYHNCRRIVALEMNPRVIAIMNGPLSGRGGQVYRARSVEVLNQEARGHLAGGSEKFDLIQLPAVDAFGASGAGVYAGRESYLYTVEAFEKMLSGLARGGMICVTRWARMPPRDALRVVGTACEALRRSGRSPRAHLAVIRSWATVSVVIFEMPVSADQGDAVRAFCRDRGFDLCHLPDLAGDEVNRFHKLDRPYCYEGVRAILGQQRDEYLAGYLFDVRPTTDDRPYFYHFLRLRSLPELNRRLGRLGRAYLELGYLLLLATFVQSVPLSAVMIVLPLIGRAGTLRRTSGKKRAFAYFLLIGVGFMFLEMCFLQRLTLYLAHPLYSAAVVIGAFLVFAGIGSRLSTSWGRPAKVVIRRASLAVAVLAAIHIFALDWLLRPTQAWPVWTRAIMVVAAIAPLAVAMGHMFPTAMRSLGIRRPALVPWCWAVNGFGSVVATVGATLLAMEVGFTVVAALGAGLYVAAAIVRPFPAGR